jgi:hypothetical protein
MPLVHAIVLAIILAPVAAIIFAVGAALLQRRTTPGKTPAEPNRGLWVWACCYAFRRSRCCACNGWRDDRSPAAEVASAAFALVLDHLRL